MNDVSEVSEANQLITFLLPPTQVGAAFRYIMILHHNTIYTLAIIKLNCFQGEEDEVSSIADEDDCENLHRKFMRRNVPLYLPKIVIPKHETQG